MNTTKHLLAIPLLLFACKKEELRPATCPADTVIVDNVCRSTCTSDSDCLLSEVCLNRACVPRLAEEGPSIRLFEADRLIVTRDDPRVRFDYVVTNASSVDLNPMPGALGEHAGTIELLLEETTDFVLVGRSPRGQDMAMRRVEVIDPLPPGQLAVSLAVDRFEPEPCAAVTVQWTVVGQHEPGTLSVRINADGAEVFTSNEASGRTTIYLDEPATLMAFANASDASGTSAATPAEPAILCSATASSRQVAVGDSVLLEWRTKGAAVVLVEEEGPRGRLYTHPVLDRTKEVVGRWLVLPDPGNRRYRIIAQKANQGDAEQIELEVSAIGERPPPMIDSFTVTPEWFRAPGDLAISYATRGAEGLTLSVNDSVQALSGPNGEVRLSPAETVDLWLHAERNGMVTSLRRYAWSTIDEEEPNGEGAPIR